jgi:hypothetical protein
VKKKKEKEKKRKKALQEYALVISFDRKFNKFRDVDSFMLELF